MSNHISYLLLFLESAGVTFGLGGLCRQALCLLLPACGGQYVLAWPQRSRSAGPAAPGALQGQDAVGFPFPPSLAPGSLRTT